jgi:hypothetical protein
VTSDSPCPRCGCLIEDGTYHDPISSRILRGRHCAVVAIPSRLALCENLGDDA